ncbi:ATP-binding protein [Kitasatospora sp. NPDC006697]|uniref:sensor histidine kinase n=1 Tax=Kitasatospora sp. NPDC006697 TaxID=3364020 RepID=UPI0036B42EE4
MPQEIPFADSEGGSSDGSGRRAAGTSRWTTRRWLLTGVAASSALLIGLGSLGAWVFLRADDATDRLVNRTSPALVAAVHLETGLLDQETGIRGYGLTGRTDFLTPYQDGLAEQRQATGDLRSALAGDGPALADLDTVLQRAEAWQRAIAQPLAATPAGTPAPAAGALADQGKSLFDSLRAAISVQQRHLQSEEAAARADLAAAKRLRDLVVALIACVLAALAALVFEGLRRGVTRPVGQLAHDAALVAGGSFEHPITPTGPADLRQLAHTVEAMRRRLADELAFSVGARRTLDEQAADLRRSNTELEQFAYVASHDLQEPLRKVASFCQLLQRRYAEQLDERANQYIEFAVDGANRMQTLINDLLAFSRVGRLHSDVEPVALDALLEQTLRTLSLRLEESGAEVTHDPLPTVTGDPTQLGALLQNLISNAVKFRSPERPPRIHLEAEPDGEQWRFAVRDNGIGIDPEYADKVFVIFQRLHTRDAYQGNGIGLAICKKIVEFHGGAIDVDQDHSPGARITFTLPVPEERSPAGPADAEGEFAAEELV